MHVVAVDPKNLPFNFGQNPISHSFDINDVEFLVDVVVVVVVGGV